MRTHNVDEWLQPGAACLFLDVDGTLLELAATPDAVSADTSLLQLLHATATALSDAMALVSGRSLAQLDTLLAPRRWPAAGLHGAERRDARGRVHRYAGIRAIPESMLPELTALAAAHPGLLLEHKGAAVALHYRQADPALETQLHSRLVDLVHRHAKDFLQVQAGACVLEVKPAGVNKASAIEAFLAERPFKGRIPVFAGDDLTDQHGFAAVERHRGLSIAVGPRVRAMLNLESPTALRALLQEFVQRAQVT